MWTSTVRVDGNARYPQGTTRPVVGRDVGDRVHPLRRQRLSPAALLFQNGLQDQLVDVVDATLYQQAGSEPKTTHWYAAGHGLNLAAMRDRAFWLQERIGIDAGRY